MINIAEQEFLNSPKEVLNKMVLENETIHVVSQKGGYVIIDEKEWRNIYETLYINSIKGLNKSIIAASKEPIDKATPLDKIDW